MSTAGGEADEIRTKADVGLESRLLGDKRTSISGDWMSVHSHKETFKAFSTAMDFPVMRR